MAAIVDHAAEARRWLGTTAAMPHHGTLSAEAVGLVAIGYAFLALADRLPAPQPEKPGAFLRCGGCGRAWTAEDLVDSGGRCPACGKGLVAVPF